MKSRTLLIVLLVICTAAIAADATYVTIANETGKTVYELYASPVQGRAWGRDLLGDDVLRTGESVEVRIKAAGRFDIMAIDEDQRRYYLANEALGPGRSVRLSEAHRYDGRDLPPQTDFGWVTVQNDTGFAVHYIYVSPAYAASWEEGEQVLPDDRILGDGEQYLVEIDLEKYRTTVYDFLLIDEDRDQYARWDVDLEEVAALRFTLENIQWN